MFTKRTDSGAAPAEKARGISGPAAPASKAAKAAEAAAPAAEAAEATAEAVAAEMRRLRARMKALRAAVGDRAPLDAKIFENLFACPAVARAEGVFVYCSFAAEADTRGIIRELLARGKRVYLPRTEGREMFAVRYTGGEIRTGKFGIPEPVGAETADKPDACILPLLAADGQFRRLGYGGGYYDRYFSRKGADLYKIGLCYDFQIVGEVPSEPHDVLLDALVTDARVLLRASSEDL